ncbi:hypothetical protein CTE05_12180 [Cellulomonas terrae]|uniref:Methyltransferase FkbM domain-containing protein n=1 Tax=Cellulomonas terrae TaxID=311234 RepID=A0A511JI37_9CELL|nr:hypothetical protein CTE05_12180 [Cellulomonas terrae]
MLTRTRVPVHALEGLRAHTLADRADRIVAHGEIVAVRLPPSARAWRSTPRIKALRRNGSDQCVEAFRLAGWLGYERPLPDLFLGALRRRPGTVLDVGANTGVYALIAASVRGTAVHAFEAYPPVAELLRENLALNPSAARVRVVQAAASDRSGTIELFVPPPSAAIETSCSTDASFRAGSTPVPVPALTLDAYWHQVGRPEVTVVKIDVEGAEHRVLQGASELLLRSRPVSFVEVLPRADLAALERVLDDASLVDVRLSEREAVVGDRVRFHDLAWNHAFVPRERLDDFLAVVRESGLVVTVL